MLEWTSASAAAASSEGGLRRDSLVRIRDAQSRADLGMARNASVPAGWLSWGKSRDFEVTEGEDESLLFTLRWTRRLTSSWMVYDSEGRRIAKIASARGQSMRFACPDVSWRSMLCARAEGQLHELTLPHSAAGKEEVEVGAIVTSARGAELGRLRQSGPCTWLGFAQETETDPFNRMLLVALALVWRR